MRPRSKRELTRDTVELSRKKEPELCTDCEELRRELRAARRELVELRYETSDMWGGNPR